MRKKSMLKSSLAVVCSLSMSAQSMILAAVPAAAQEENASALSVDIYPTPHAVSYPDADGFAFDGTVDVVFHGAQDEATEPKLKDILDGAGITWQKVDSVTEGHAAIIISSDPDHCDDCGNLSGTALEKNQGYVLKAGDTENAKGQVVIDAHDEDGAFYGVLTLRQMLQQSQDGKIAGALVDDWPDIELRGFVEGFYGYPWGYEGRSSLMSDTSNFKMNTYIYAPKDDPYHHSNWRTLYPEKEANDIKALVEQSKKDNISFVWCVHPASGFAYNDADYDVLFAKLEQMYSLGVRQFGISFDDLGGTDYSRLAQHAAMLTKVNDEFVKVKGDVLPLITVATRYAQSWGPTMSQFKAFCDGIPEDTIVMWTGKSTMSLVDKETFDYPKDYVGWTDRDMACWWNYPVNDYCDGKMLMAALTPLANDVDNLSGFFLNPLSQPDASKVAIFSGADWSWNVSDFDAIPSWERSIEELVPDCAEAFKRFADNISGHSSETMVFDESIYLTDEINALNSALSSGSGIGEAALDMLDAFEQMLQDVTAIRATSHESLLADVLPWLNAYEFKAQAGVNAMEGLLAALDGNILAAMQAIEDLNDNNAKAAAVTVNSFESSGEQVNAVEVCTRKLGPIISQAPTQIQSILASTLSSSAEAHLISSEENPQGSVVFEGINYIMNSTMTLPAGGWVGHTMDEAHKISSILLESEQADKLRIEYSLNGIDWKAADSTEGEGTLSAAGPFEAAYVRVVNKTDDAVDVKIDGLTSSVIFEKGEMSVTTNMPTYGTNYIRYASDGNFNTKFYSASGASVGDYIRIDLGNIVPIYDMAAYCAENPKGLETNGVDGFQSAAIEISTDGTTWTQIGEVFDKTNYVIDTTTNPGTSMCVMNVNAQGALGRYIRLTCKESYENWVQIYEIQYNTTVSIFGDGTVDLIDTNITSGDPAKMFDKDLSTSFSVDAPAEGAYVEYTLTTQTDVQNLTVVQDADTISNASVYVQNAQTRDWELAGKLDEELCIFAINKQCTALKVVFEEGTAANIKEILLTDTPTEKEPCKVTLSQSEHGTLTCDAEDLDAVPYGTRVTITVTPEEGYQADWVKANGTNLSVTDGTCTLRVVKDTEITVSYSAIEYALNLPTSHYGTVTVEDDLTSIPYNGSFTLVLTPNEDCMLVSVTINGQSVQPKDGKVKVENVKEQPVIEVVFAPYNSSEDPAWLALVDRANAVERTRLSEDDLAALDEAVAGEDIETLQSVLDSLSFDAPKSLGLIDTSNAKVLSYTSQYTGEGENGNGAVDLTIDGNTSTYWHSDWADSTSRLPQQITYDLNGVYELSDVSFLPISKSGGVNGDWLSTEVYAGTDPDNLTLVGTFDYGYTTTDEGRYRIENYTQWHDMSFAPIEARYVKVNIVKSSSDGGPGWSDENYWASAAEVRFYSHTAGMDETNAAINEAATLKTEENYSRVDESHRAYLEAAAAAASPVLDNVQSSGAALDAVREPLEAAIATVKLDLARISLQDLVDEVKDVQQGDYSQSTWTAFTAARTAAQNAIASAETAEEMAQAEADLQAAYDALSTGSDAVVLDTELLELVLNALNLAKAEDYSNVPVTLPSEGAAGVALVVDAANKNASQSGTAEDQAAIDASASSLNRSWMALRLIPEGTKLASLK